MSSSGKILYRKWVPALLGAVALVLCVIMSLHSLSGSGLAGCGPGSSCDGVLGSRWSLILGILPVSVLAAGVYVTFLICLFLVDSVDDEFRPAVWSVLLVVSGAVAGSAVWFILLQYFEIGMFCKYCMAAHSIGLVLAVVMLVISGKCGVTCRRRLLSFLAGILLAAFLACFQFMTVDRNFYQEGYSDSLLPDMASEGFPMIGDADAGNVFELLYDYQCPHCRKVHEAAAEIVKSYPDKYAFVLCPTPLSNVCNPYIPAGKDYFPGSCDYARLALAVWQLAPSHFKEMDSFLWTSPSVAEARAYAATLVDPSVLDGWLSGDSAFRTLSLCFDLFGRTNTGDKAGLPRIVLGQSWIIPEISDASGLLDALSSLEK